MSREYLQEYALRYEFRRRFFRIFLACAILLLLVNIGLALLILANKHFQPIPPYFITTSDGRVVELTPINR